MSDRGENYVDLLPYGEIGMVGPEDQEPGQPQQRVPRDIPVPGDDEVSDWGARLVDLGCCQTSTILRR